MLCFGALVLVLVMLLTLATYLWLFGFMVIAPLTLLTLEFSIFNVDLYLYEPL